MSGVATAVVAGAVISGYMGKESAEDAAAAAERGAGRGIDATMDATLMQLEEMRYQFDYAQAALASGRQAQYNAQNAFSTMLGINGPNTDVGGDRASYSQLETGSGTPSLSRGAGTGGGRGGGGDSGYLTSPPPERPEYKDHGAGYKEAMNQYSQERDQWYQNEQSAREAVSGQSTMLDRYGNIQTFGANAEFAPNVGERGFVDPMADPTRMAGPSQDTDIMTRNVMANRLAGPDVASDPFFQYTGDTAGYENVAARSLAGPTYQEDPYFSRVADTGYTPEGYAPGTYEANTYTPEMLTTDTFEASPGYNFQLEQGMNTLSNRNSAGGNYGGAALKEAMRYGEGVAQQDYYNWAGLRQGDLSRQDTASQFNLGREDTANRFNIGNQVTADQFNLARTDESARFNRGREDRAMESYLSRQGADAGRLDQQLNIDTARQDQSFMDYLNRQGMDINRMDSATLNYLQRQQYDVQRGDTMLNNYMSRLGSTAGLGGDVQGSVASAQNTGSQVANVYANQGNRLSNIYQNLGGAQANAAYQGGAAVNNAVQGGISNWMLHQQLQNPATNMPPPGGLPMGTGNSYAGYA